MSRIRVAYMPSRLVAAGAERQMMTLAERLPRDRFEIDFLVFSGHGNLDDRAVAAGARIHHLGELIDVNASLPRRTSVQVGKIVRFLRLARERRYDIIDGWLFPADMLAALTRPLTGVPVVIAGRRNVESQARFGPLQGPLERLTDRGIDLVVANSRAAATNAIQHQHVDPGHVKVIHNGVAIPPEPTAAERSAARAALGIGDADIVVGAVANHRPVKRTWWLLDAAAATRDVPGLRFELIGGGDLHQDMAERVHALGLDDRVTVHGAVPDAAPLMAAFDIVVQTSEREGLPNTLLEAAAAGRAIVATAAGGTDEIVIDGQTGLLVPVDDQAGFLRALRQAIVDPPLRARLGAAAREHATTTFGMDRFVASFAEAYETLVAARGGPRADRR